MKTSLVFGFIIISFLGISQNRISVVKSDTLKVNFLVNYPEQAADAGIEGKITFLIDIDSTCSFVKITPDVTLGFGLDKEALRGVKVAEREYKRTMKSKCSPMKNMVLPIVFRLL